MGYQSLKNQTSKSKYQKFNLKDLKKFLILISFYFLFFNCVFLNLESKAYAQISFDPLAIGIGARALGMGKTNVAVAESADTLFANPAGLGEIDSFQFTSMGGKILDEVAYTMLGGVYPLGGQSAMGVGYVGSFVSGIEIRNASGSLWGTSNYGNNIVLISLAKKFETKTSLGINFKYYLIDCSEINAGDGQGWNIDLGILQSDLNWLSLGLVGQNLLRPNKVTYQNGEKEDFPLTFKLGAKFFLLGSGYKSALYSPWELNIVVDGEWGFQKSKPFLLHLGSEFSPVRFLTVRAGIDDTIFTSGVSLKIAGLGLHYAYQPLAQYFSITFDERGWPPETPPDVFLGMQP